MRIRNNVVPFLVLVVGSLVLAKTITYGEDFWVNRSTNVTGAATLYAVPEVYPGDYLGSLIINTRGSSGAITIFDSSATATGKSFGVIPLSSAIPAGITLEGYSHQTTYMISLSSGLTYTKTGNADITITFRQKRAR